MAKAESTVAPAAAPGIGESALRRHLTSTFGLSALTLGVNLVTGVLIARALGAAGRGELVAIQTVVQMVGWAGAVGALQAVSYWQAKRPQDSGRLISTWFVLALPLGLLCVGVGEAVLPHVLAAQSDSTVDLARLFLLTVVLAPLGELVWGVLLGDQDFLFVNAMRFAQPAAVALSYVGLWAAGELTVVSALLVAFLTGLAALLVAAVRMLRRHRPARPSATLAKTTLWYGLRAHGTNLTGMANIRLDLLLLPAFLGAVSVGLYSIATNVSWIVVMLAGALGGLVLPAAARASELGPRTVVHSLQVTLILALLLAVVLALVANAGIRFVYGDEFAGAVTPLLILLPGSALLPAAGVLQAGLFALNRPFTAAAANAGGVIVTIVGLLVFLRSYGITAAAIVSSVAYAVIFAASLVLYRRAAALEWSAFVPVRGASEHVRPAAAATAAHPTVTVLVPTYRRSERLRGCLRALDNQRLAPLEVVVVARAGDPETDAVLREAARGDEWLRVVSVTEPGVVAALRAGLQHARGDVVAFTDDDAEPRADWVEQLSARFAADQVVGAVGGRDSVHVEGRTLEGEARRVGTLSWFGRAVGNHHVGLTPRSVDFLKGVNMAIRRELIPQPDPALRGSGAQIAWDLQLSLAVSRAGWDVLYDPAVAVDHYPSERHDHDQREAPSLAAQANAAHNDLYVLLRLTPWWQKPIAATYALLVGTRRAPGLALLVEGFARGPGRRDLVDQFWVVTRARLAAIRSATLHANAGGARR